MHANNDIAVDADGVSVCEEADEKKTGRVMRESKASHNQVGRTCLAVSYLSHMHVLLLGRLAPVAFARPPEEHIPAHACMVPSSGKQEKRLFQV